MKDFLKYFDFDVRKVALAPAQREATLDKLRRSKNMIRHSRPDQKEGQSP